jgi:hypothetical protein
VCHITVALAADLTLDGTACHGPTWCDGGHVLLDENYGTRCWCYTDDINSNWDWVCDPSYPCGLHDQHYNWCYTDTDNSIWNYCATNETYYTVKGTQCYAPMQTSYVYGTVRYWCYTDESKNWDYVCEPSAGCSQYDDYYDYYWCWTSPWSTNKVMCKNATSGI